METNEALTRADEIDDKIPTPTQRSALMVLATGEEMRAPVREDVLYRMAERGWVARVRDAWHVGSGPVRGIWQIRPAGLAALSRAGQAELGRL